MSIATASQTIGPYWHLIEDKTWSDLTRFGAHGEKIVVTGTVYDGDGKPCPEACVEIWQVDPPASDIFPAFGRSNTDATGTYRFVTLRPGPAPGPGNSQQAPHIAIRIFSRGLMRPLATRAYFQDEALNASDPLLHSIEDPLRRATLIATPRGGGTWQLDIRLQGAGETLFLEM